MTWRWYRAAPPPEPLDREIMERAQVEIKYEVRRTAALQVEDEEDGTGAHTRGWTIDGPRREAETGVGPPRNLGQAGRISG